MAGFRIAREIHSDPTPKTKAVKSLGYLSFIRQLPSAVSGQYGVEACHLSFPNTLFCHYGRGKGSKASDPWALPLTPAEHRAQHSGSEEEFWLQAGIDPHATATALWMAYSTLGDEAIAFASARIMAGLADANRLREREI